MDYLGQDHLTGVLYGLVNLSLALIREAFQKLRGLGLRVEAWCMEVRSCPRTEDRLCHGLSCGID